MQTHITELRHYTSRFLLFAFILVVVAITFPGAAQAQENSVTHVVKPGESLSSIATRYGTTVTALARANGITNPNYLAIGRVLTIPASPVPRATAAPANTPVTPAQATPAPDTAAATTAPEVTTTRPSTRVGVPAPDVPRSAPLTSEVVHTVYPGETLSSLASRYGTTVTAIRERNGLRSTILLVGQRLIIPSGRSSLTAPTAPVYRSVTATPAATATRDGSTLPRLLPTVEPTALPGQ